MIHIRNAARFIEADTAEATLEQFLSDRRMQQLVERNLTIIGEAVHRLKRRDPHTASRISEVPDIIGMRNVLIHGYDEINYRRVWGAVGTSLPILRREVETLLEAGERDTAE